MIHIQKENALPVRCWRARLDLEFEVKNHKSVLSRVSHEGPLRVQKPFYPESDGTCHLYILHPPGGMVVGDQLATRSILNRDVRSLLTTPSAGKIYGVKQLGDQQTQLFDFKVGANAVLEWLPQETIVFNGANGKLKTSIDLDEAGKVFVWDIVKLGRSASGERFEKGACSQALEIWRGGKPLFIERNHFIAGSQLQSASWGLQCADTSATLCATIMTTRTMVDGWLDTLQSMSRAHDSHWGLSQKNSFFIARYLGNSLSDCRRGFEFLWQQGRHHLLDKPSVVPRIWRT